MIVTAHQPTYLPWLGLFHKINISDKYVYLDNVQYLVRDWNNRNKIKTADGPKWLSIPIITKNKPYQLLNDTLIDNNINWRRKHWLTIQAYYKKTPYFNDYKDYFESFYNQSWDKLDDVNRCMLKFFLKTLGIKTKWVEAKDLNLVGHKTDLIIDVCKKTYCNQYIFGTLGRDYADKNKFKKNNIDITFQDYNHPVYNQQWGDFIPYMSIIDLLFNHGPNSLDIIMKNNIKKEEIKWI